MAPLTPQQISGLESISNIKLSKDGSKVVYQLSKAYKSKEHATSAIWIAETDKEGSSRQLTSGTYKDSQPAILPDGKSILFLSDRHKAGGKVQIYMLPLEAGGEAVPLTNVDHKKSVSSFEISPDGRYVAFTSADEPTAAEEKKEEDKDDAKVWGAHKDFERLRILSLATRTITTLNIRQDRHVISPYWHPNSKQILFQLTELPAEEMTYIGQILLQKVSIIKPNDEAITIKQLRRSAPMTIWLKDDTVLSLNWYNESTIPSAIAVCLVSESKSAKRVIYSGVQDTANGFLDVGDGTGVAVSIEDHLETRIDIIDSSGKGSTLYKTNGEGIGDFDLKLLDDGTYVLAAARSSSLRKEVSNIWTGRSTKKCYGSPEIVLKEKLSTHNQWLADANPDIKIEAFNWTAADGTPLEGVIAKPSNWDGKPLPTILCVHGGPYYRDSLDYSSSFARWRVYLASHGFCTISPNYRGGSGRGSTFAEAASGGVGTLDWTDTESMIDEAITRKIADPDRLGIAGWSQGAFMTAWGVSQTKNKFKAAAMGAGASDWGAMAVEGDMPEFALELGGSAPWTPSPAKERNDPIRFVKDIETAVLILHGEKDERVPVGQAIGYMRGIRREGKFPERSQMVIYPRETHGFTEKKHVEDVLQRVLDHFNKWLN